MLPLTTPQGHSARLHGRESFRGHVPVADTLFDIKALRRAPSRERLSHQPDVPGQHPDDPKGDRGHSDKTWSPEEGEQGISNRPDDDPDAFRAGLSRSRKLMMTYCRLRASLVGTIRRRRRAATTMSTSERRPICAFEMARTSSPTRWPAKWQVPHATSTTGSIFGPVPAGPFASCPETCVAS
jgi:hypothetical protein